MFMFQVSTCIDQRRLPCLSPLTQIYISGFLQPTDNTALCLNYFMRERERKL